MSTFEWKDEYSVAVEEIDEQHKKIVALISDLITAVSNLDADLGSIMDGLIDYSDYHFATEEKYFKKFNYEKADEHIKEHRDFTKQVKQFKKELSVELGIEQKFKLIDFLENWFINHTTGIDQEYVECFQKNGLK